MTIKNAAAVASLLTLSVANSSYGSPAFESSERVNGTETHSAPVSRPASTRGAASLGSRAEEARYAAREAAAPAAKNYRAGDVVVISTTALVIVLLVILIIVLI